MSSTRVRCFLLILTSLFVMLRYAFLANASWGRSILVPVATLVYDPPDNVLVPVIMVPTVNQSTLPERGVVVNSSIREAKQENNEIAAVIPKYKYYEHLGLYQETLELFVVYFHMQPIITKDHYVWESICSTLNNHNYVIFATTAHMLEIPHELRNKFEVFLFNETLETKTNLRLRDFRSKYRLGWGYREPFERICIERFFFLEAFVEARGLQRFFYMDSDVALRSRIKLATDLPEDCEALLPLRVGGSKLMTDYHWSVYIGTGSILTKSVLSEFNWFVLRMYQSESGLRVLQEKFDKKPFVTDMTLWYLYVVASSPFFQTNSSLVSRNFTDRLPSLAPRQFCDGFDVGFRADSYQKWKRRGGQPRNIHFHGPHKKYLKDFCLTTTRQNESES